MIFQKSLYQYWHFSKLLCQYQDLSKLPGLSNLPTYVSSIDIQQIRGKNTKICWNQANVIGFCTHFAPKFCWYFHDFIFKIISNTPTCRPSLATPWMLRGLYLWWQNRLSRESDQQTDTGNIYIYMKSLCDLLLNENGKWKLSFRWIIQTLKSRKICSKLSSK